LWTQVADVDVLNHMNFDLPDAFIDDPAVGPISSAEASREIQISLRLKLQFPVAAAVFPRDNERFCH
jgi:hypothetical protein